MALRCAALAIAAGWTITEGSGSHFAPSPKSSVTLASLAAILPSGFATTQLSALVIVVAGRALHAAGGRLPRLLGDEPELVVVVVDALLHGARQLR